MIFDVGDTEKVIDADTEMRGKCRDDLFIARKMNAAFVVTDNFAGNKQQIRDIFLLFIVVFAQLS